MECRQGGAGHRWVIVSIGRHLIAPTIDFEARTLCCRPQARPAGSSVAEGSGGGGSVAAYKAAAGATIDEYFASGEVGEVVRRLVELDEPALANMFLKQVPQPNESVHASAHVMQFC